MCEALDCKLDWSAQVAGRAHGSRDDFDGSLHGDQRVGGRRPLDTTIVHEFDFDDDTKLWTVGFGVGYLLGACGLARADKRGFNRVAFLRFEKEFGVWRTNGRDFVSGSRGWHHHFAAHDFSPDSIDCLCCDRETFRKKQMRFVLSWGLYGHKRGLEALEAHV